jgi:serine/threonine protein kinase
VRRAREMGSYLLGGRIGAGGMGEVWQATHRFLARPAAIKLIKPDVLGAMTKEQGEVLVQRFRREARAAANLRSPHTIQLYDFGVVRAMGPSTMSWSCSTGWMCRPWLPGTARCHRAE